MAITLILIIILCFALVFYFLKFLISRIKIYILSWQLPGPPAYPIVGNALIYLCKDEEILDRSVEFISKYPSPFRFWFGPKFTIIIKDAEQLAKIMPSTNFITKDKIYEILEVVDGKGLITASGTKWKKDRKLMSTLFEKKNMEQYMECIENHVQHMVNILEKKVDGPMFNVETFMHRCIADVINETILGTKTYAQNGGLDTFLDEVDKMYELLHAKIVKVWLQIGWIFRLTHYYEIQEKSARDILSFIRNNLRVTEKNRQEGSLSNSVLDQILDIRDNNENWANEEELVHHLTTLYSASEDTITTISSFALLLLGMYQEIQTKIVNEISEVIGNKTDLNLDDLSKLPFLDMCIKDVLRLYPIAPFIMRVATDDFKLNKIVIPKGCTVILSIFNVQRDPLHWEKPNEFYPEHFLPETVKKRHPYAFIPFSAGPRGCLGKSYANIALKIIIITILRKYVIYAKGTIHDIKLKADISVRKRDRQYNIQLKLRI